MSRLPDNYTIDLDFGTSTHPARRVEVRFQRARMEPPPLPARLKCGVCGEWWRTSIGHHCHGEVTP